MNINIIFDKVLNNQRITDQEALSLFEEANIHDLGNIAHIVRSKKHNSQQVSYIVDRNINYTNVCTAGCRFCAFAYPPQNNTDTYVLKYSQIHKKIQELIDCGGVQILLQGGHNPQLAIEYYEDLFQRIKQDFPQITIHALSPSELEHICKVSEITLDDCITRLKTAGWESLPGGGAEILVERVRNRLSPLKTTSEAWLNIAKTCHEHNIYGSATMMFGHVETYAERIEHMSKLRALQDQTHGFRAFISWPFQHGNTPLSKDPEVQDIIDDNGLDYLRTQAISRIFFDNIDNIQASWVTMGLGIGQVALHYGANDFGGTMLEENVVSAAGTQHSKSNKSELEYYITQAGFEPVQRNTFYDLITV